MSDIQYKQFILSPKTVLNWSPQKACATTTETARAYQIIEPESGYIYGTFPTIERAQKAIDKHGYRWLLCKGGKLEGYAIPSLGNPH